MACGYDEEVVLGLDRSSLTSTYAELLAAGNVGTPAAPILSCDIELEKQKFEFEFEQKKWAVEMEVREKQRKLEDQLVLRKQEFEREQAIGKSLRRRKEKCLAMQFVHRLYAWAQILWT